MVTAVIYKGINDKDTNDVIVKSQYYDDDNDCTLKLVTVCNSQLKGYVLEVHDYSEHSVRGYSIKDLSIICREVFNQEFNIGSDISNEVLQFYNKHYNKFIGMSDKEYAESLYVSKYDDFQFLNVLRSILISRYENCGLAEVSGVFMLSSGREGTIGIKIKHINGNEVIVRQLPVFFDGQYMYTPYHGMKSESPYEFMSNVIDMNFNVYAASNSLLPLKFSKAMSDKAWHYLTGIMLPKTESYYTELINEVADGDGELAHDEQFRHYIINKNRKYL